MTETMSKVTVARKLREETDLNPAEVAEFVYKSQAWVSSNA